MDFAKDFTWVVPLFVGALLSVLAQWYYDKRKARILRSFAESLFWVQAGTVPFSISDEDSEQPVHSRPFYISAVDILLQAGVLGTSDNDLQLMQALAELKRCQERHNQAVIMAKEFSLQTDKNEEFYSQYLREVGDAHTMLREAIVWVKAVLPSFHSTLWPRPDWPDDYEPKDEYKPYLSYKKTKQEGRYFQPKPRKVSWRSLRSSKDNE